MPPMSTSGTPILCRSVAGLARRVRETPARAAVGVIVFIAAYLGAMRIGVGELKPVQLLLCAPLVLVFGGEGPRRFFSGMLPLWLFGIVYDMTHITEPFFRYLHIHVVEPYWFDKTLFAIRTAEGVLTPNEFFAIHHWPWVDFITGLSYILFIYWPFGFAAGLAIFRRDEVGRRLLMRFGWTFLIMNIVGFATYYIYPAAPPWYVAKYGLGPANLSAQSSAAGAARFDALTGLSYFAAFYGHSADVFGAIPSLHPTYPLLTFLYGRELGKRWLDLASFGLFALVAFAAVYLDHHYILDVALGILYTLAAWRIELAIEKRRRARAEVKVA